MSVLHRCNFLRKITLCTWMSIPFSKDYRFFKISFEFNEMRFFFSKNIFLNVNPSHEYSDGYIWMWDFSSLVIDAIHAFLWSLKQFSNVSLIDSILLYRGLKNDDDRFIENIRDMKLKYCIFLYSNPCDRLLF